MADDLAKFASNLRGLAKDLDGPGMSKVIGEIGDVAVARASEAVRADLGGDGRMSRWPRARFDIRARPLGSSSLSVEPISRGPMAVAERGRRAGVARSGRKVSSSRGLRTWSDAGRRLESLGSVVEGKVTRLIEGWLR